MPSKHPHDDLDVYVLIITWIDGFENSSRGNKVISENVELFVVIKMLDVEV